MINTTNIYNYVCFDKEENYLKLPSSERYANIFKTVYNASSFYLSMIPRLFQFYNPNCCIPQGDKNDWKSDNKGLFVIIHGLYGNPRFSDVAYLEQIEKDRPNQYEIRVPYVPYAGNCSLEDAAKPILEMIKDYIKENPGKPINLIGTSNGGRIAGYIETNLRDQNVNIRITGIAGLFFGSKTMTLLNKYKISSYLFAKEVTTECCMASPKAVSLIKKMQQPISSGSRTYEFYATANDAHIPNFSSCFPKIDNANYNLITGQDHLSLANFICQTELVKAYNWMDLNSKVNEEIL